GLNGHTRVKSRTTDIDVDAFTVLGDLDGVPWMSYAGGRNGRLAFYNDIFYARLGVGPSVARSLHRLAIDSPLWADSQQTIIEAGAAYEIGKWHLFTGTTALDVLAGARYWRQDVAINLAFTATLDAAGLVLSRGRAIARAGDVDWVDPLIGLRIRH